MRVRVANIKKQDHIDGGPTFQNSNCPSFFEEDLAADNSLEVPVFGADEQRAFISEGFGAAADLAFSYADDHLVTKSLAMFLPFFAQTHKTAAAHPCVIPIQLSQ